MKTACLITILLLAACDSDVHYTQAAPIDDVTVSPLEGEAQ